MRDGLSTTIKSYDQSAVAYENTIATITNYDESYGCFFGLLNKDDSVLDLACGPANISSKLKQALPDAFITGVDLSEKMVELAKRNVPDGNFITADIVSYKSENPNNAIIIGFALPYLTFEESQSLIENTRFNLYDNGKIYISFMDGEKEGYERPSFNQSVQLYIYYHKHARIRNLLQNNGFKILKEWIIDYLELDGSVTKDIVIIAEKECRK
jgi:ubiquinone/menaquinone biosynthesis C-methylase UbiE